MAIDFNRIKTRLDNLRNPKSGQRPNILWRPNPGKQSIRLVPYKVDPTYPFVELWFHYDLAGKTWLSPITFGRPDPVVEYAKKLRKSGDESLAEQAKELFAKKRNFSPILVRGLEAEGVKWWGYGKEVFESLLAFADEGEFGDITDPVNGYDLIADHKTAAELGTTYSKTSVRPKAKPSPLLPDPVDPVLLKKIIEDQPDIMNVWKEPTYDELNDALYRHLNPQESDSSSSEADSAVDESVEPPESAVIVVNQTQDNTPDKLPDEGEEQVKDVVVAPEPKVTAGPPVSPTAAKSSKGQNFNEVFAAFDNIIKKK